MNFTKISLFGFFAAISFCHAIFSTDSSGQPLLEKQNQVSVHKMLEQMLNEYRDDILIENEFQNSGQALKAFAERLKRAKEQQTHYGNTQITDDLNRRILINHCEAKLYALMNLIDSNLREKAKEELVKVVNLFQEASPDALPKLIHAYLVQSCSGD